MCPSCIQSRCSGHATVLLTAVCSTIQELTAAKIEGMRAASAEAYRHIDEAAAACNNQPKKQLHAVRPTAPGMPLSFGSQIHRVQVKFSAASAKTAVDDAFQEERSAVAVRARDALSLVLTSLEVCADGDAGAHAALAPALLHAVQSVQSQGSVKFVLLPPQGGKAGVGTVVHDRSP